MLPQDFFKRFSKDGCYLPHVVAPSWFAYPSANPFCDFVHAAVWQGAKLTVVGDGTVVFGPIADYQVLSIQRVVELFRCGCDIYNYDCFIAIPRSKYCENVPDYLNFVPERSTWDLWCGIHHNHLTIGEIVYVATNSLTDVLLEPNLIAHLLNDGYQLVTNPELRSIQARSLTTLL